MTAEPHIDQAPEFEEKRATDGVPWLRHLLVLLALGLILTALILDNGPDSTESASPPPASDSQPDGSAARAWLKKAGRAADLEAVYQQALQYDKAGARADAWLLYYFAARKGHGPSALALGRRADPLHFDAAKSVTGNPEPYEAYKWYRIAEKAGVAEAAEDLGDLRGWVDEQADKGDLRAQRLRLLWQ
ncbi:MAG TPA: hypothetical protein ENK26_01650 [Gammaproteobacteria bacterium]|nr:hypothetical protein [Gammaproteobacteria bacterium]